jgi:hypothetical protein
MEDFYIEEQLLNSVKMLLRGRVNELLGETEFHIPPIEFGQSGFTGSVTPVISLSPCERSEKEWIVQLDAYTLTVTFIAPEHQAGERNCYAYASSVAAALREDPTLSGAASRAELAGKKYSPPKQSGTGGEWELELKIHILVEEMSK